MDPIVQPGDLPISVSIPGGISPGRCVVVEGTVPDHAESFSIRLQCGPKVNGREDIPLSVKFTFEDNHGDFLVTSMLDEEWGVEECRMTKENLWYIWGSDEPLSPGDACCIAIECHDMGYKIFLDSEQVHDYTHRTDYAHIGYLVLLGDFEVTRAGVVGGSGPTRWLIMRAAEPQTWNTRVVTLLTDENYSNKILHSSYMWVIMFYTPPCQMKAEFELAALKVTTLLRGKVRFGSVNCLVNIDTAVSMKVHRCPTILYYPKGSRKSLTVAQRYTGAYSANGIGNWVSHVYQELKGPPPGLNASMPVQQPILLVTRAGMQKARPEGVVTPDTLDSEYWDKASIKQMANDLVDRRVSFKDENCVYCAHDNTYNDSEAKEHLLTLLELDRRLSELIKQNIEKNETLVVEEKDLFGSPIETNEDIEKIKREIAMEIQKAQEEENEELGREKGIEAEKDEIEEAQKKLVKEFRDRVLSAENTLINKSVSVINLYVPELRKELRQFMQAIHSVERARCILAKVQSVYKGKNEAGTSKPNYNIVDEVFSEKIFSTDPALDRKASDMQITSKPVKSESSPTDSGVNKLRNILSSINLMQPHTDSNLEKDSHIINPVKVPSRNGSPLQSPSLIENVTNCINLHSITKLCETCQDNNIAAFNAKVTSNQNQNMENLPHKSILKKVSRIQTENAEESLKEHSNLSLDVVKSKVVINTNDIKLKTPSKTSLFDNLPIVRSFHANGTSLKGKGGKKPSNERCLCKSQSSIRSIISRIFGIAALHLRSKTNLVPDRVNVTEDKTDSGIKKLENETEVNVTEMQNLKEEEDTKQLNLVTINNDLATDIKIKLTEDIIDSITEKLENRNEVNVLKEQSLKEEVETEDYNLPTKATTNNGLATDINIELTEEKISSATEKLENRNEVSVLKEQSLKEEVETEDYNLPTKATTNNGLATDIKIELTEEKIPSTTEKLENNNEVIVLKEQNLKEEKEIKQANLEILQKNEEYTSLSYTSSTPYPTSDDHNSTSTVNTKDTNNELINAPLLEKPSNHSILNENKLQSTLKAVECSNIVGNKEEIYKGITISPQTDSISPQTDSIPLPKLETSNHSVISGNDPQNSFETSGYSSAIENTNGHGTIVSVDVTIGTEELHLNQTRPRNEVIIIKHNNAMEIAQAQRRTFMMLCDTGSSEIQLDSSVTEVTETVSQTSETAKESTENWSPVEKPSKNSLADELMRHLTELQRKEAAARSDYITPKSLKSLISITRKTQFETKITTQEIEFSKIVEVKVDKIMKDIVKSEAMDENVLKPPTLAPSVKSIENTDVSDPASSSENAEFSSTSQTTNEDIVKQTVPVPPPLVTSVKPIKRSHSAPGILSLADIPGGEIIATSSDTALVPRSNVVALEAGRLMGLFTREQRERWWARLLSRRAAHCLLL